MLHMSISNYFFILQATSINCLRVQPRAFSFSLILVDIYNHYFKNILLEKIHFPFKPCYVDDIFTFIDTSLNNIDYILQVMNSMSNNMQFTFEIENNGALFFFYTIHLFLALMRASQLLSQKLYCFPATPKLILTILLVKKWLHFTLLFPALQTFVQIIFHSTLKSHI